MEKNGKVKKAACPFAVLWNNGMNGTTSLSSLPLDRAFDAWYPRLEEDLAKVKTVGEPSTKKANGADDKKRDAILEEIL